MVDGIRVKNSETIEGMDFLLLNCADDYEAELSVDRLQLMTINKSQQQAQALVCDTAWRAILGATKVSLTNLVNLVKAQPLALAQLDTALVNKEVELNVTADTEETVTLAGIGLSAFDSLLDDSDELKRLFHPRSYGFAFGAEMVIRQRIVELKNINYPLVELLNYLARFDSDYNDHEHNHRINVASSVLLLSCVLNSSTHITLDFTSLLRYSEFIDLPLAQTIKFISPLIDMGMSRLSQPQVAAIAAGTLTTKHLKLLALYKRNTGVVADKIHLNYLFMASCNWTESLSELVELVTPMIDLGMTNFTFPEAKMVLDTQFSDDALSLIDAHDFWFTSNSTNLIKFARIINADKKGERTLAERIEDVMPFVKLGLTPFSSQVLQVLTENSLPKESLDLYLLLAREAETDFNGLLTFKGIYDAEHTTTQALSVLLPLFTALIDARLTVFNHVQLTIFEENYLPVNTLRLLEHVVQREDFYSTIDLSSVIGDALEINITLDEMIETVTPLIDKRLTAFDCVRFKSLVAFLESLTAAELQVWCLKMEDENVHEQPLDLNYLIGCTIKEDGSFAHHHKMYQRFLKIPAIAESYIVRFNALPFFKQKSLFEAWNRQNNTISLITIALYLIEKNANWEAIKAGFELLALCGADITEAKAFIHFCQAEFEKEAG